MATEFQVVRDPQARHFDELESTFPANAFYSRAYAAAMAEGGESPSIVGVWSDGRLASGCTAFVRQGRLARALEIASLPPLGGVAEAFWSGLRDYCSKAGVTELGVYTFSSPQADIPSLGVETWRAKRVEFVLDLDGSDPWDQLDKKHRQSIVKARQANLQLRTSVDPSALDIHVRLMAGSLERHKDRGEQVPDEGDGSVLRALVDHRAARIHQVLDGDRVLSSATILRSASGAYYHTAGNHPDGLALGASHFLLYETAALLSRESVTEFNLGGTDPGNEGLVRFKRRFGARVVNLEAATFSVGSSLRRGMIAAARGLRSALP